MLNTLQQYLHKIFSYYLIAINISYNRKLINVVIIIFLNRLKSSKKFLFTSVGFEVNTEGIDFSHGKRDNAR